MKTLKFETMEAAIAAMDHGENPEWENVANGEVAFELPDGSKWARVYPGGFTEYDERYERFLNRHVENERSRFIQENAPHLVTEQRAERLDFLLFSHSLGYERMASVSEALPIHDIFVNITHLEPTRGFCMECGGWIDLTQEEYHPREDNPMADDPPIRAPGTRTRQ